MSLDYELGYLLGRESARTGESEREVREKLIELLTPVVKTGRPRKAHTKYFVEGQSRALSQTTRDKIAEAQRKRWQEEKQRRRNQSSPGKSPGRGWVLSKSGNWISPKHIRAMRANIAKGRNVYLAKLSGSQK